MIEKNNSTQEVDKESKNIAKEYVKSYEDLIQKLENTKTKEEREELEIESMSLIQKISKEYGNVDKNMKEEDVKLEKIIEEKEILNKKTEELKNKEFNSFDKIKNGIKTKKTISKMIKSLLKYF